MPAIAKSDRLDADRLRTKRCRAEETEEVEGWQEMEAKKKLALVIDCACTDGRMGRAIQKMWSVRFG